MGRTQRRRQKRNKQTKFTDLDEHASEQLEALYKYLHALNWHNKTQLSVRTFTGSGRGLCSKTRQFSIGEELIRLPVECLITLATLEADIGFKALFNVTQFHKDRRITYQTLLAFYVLYQNHQNVRSPLYAYLRTVPKNFTTPYFCPLNELQCLPDAILERTVSQNRKIRENFALLLQLLQLPAVCNCCGGDNFADIYTLNAFKWAYFVVNTRSVFVDSRQLTLPAKQFFSASLLADSTNLALAPFLDLFNHSDQVSTSAQLELHGKDPKHLDYVLTLVSGDNVPIPRYDQIFISYGALTNLKLLTEYGFFLQDNRHDYFELSLADIESFLKQTPPYSTQVFHRNKFKFIREHNLHDQLFVHTCDGMSHNLRVVLHLLLKEQSYFPNILNQVAFGAATELASMDDEIVLLIKFKIEEYETFTKALKKLPTLSDSGAIVIEYMHNSVGYLKAYLDANFS